MNDQTTTIDELLTIIEAAKETVRSSFPEAHCAPLADAHYPDFYVIRATRTEWAETLAKGPTPDRAWRNAAKELQPEAPVSGLTN